MASVTPTTRESHVMITRVYAVDTRRAVNLPA